MKRQNKPRRALLCALKPEHVMKKSRRNFLGILASFSLGLAAPAAVAEPGTIYISPNNDGVQDSLVVPLKVREKRYVTEWNFIITNEAGEVVRTISNKISLPSKLTLKSLAKSIATPKQSVAVPAEIVWNGFLDDGSLAPDGTYYYQFTAADDNGNTASTSRMQVVVDNTPPEAVVAPLEGAEKIFGEGSKAVLKIRQTGSAEDLWTARITDENGAVVRSYKWENAAPLDIEWNGTDEKKMIVPDGVYSYEIASTDRAGNTSVQGLSNIIFSAEKPETAVFIAGSRYFSPAPKGSVAEQRKTVRFGIAIPSPAASVNSLTEWSIDIVGKKDGTSYYSKSGRTNPPSEFVFDGRSSSGAVLADGEYRAKVTARYLNGYEPEPAYSPVFVLDNEPPKAEVSLPENTVFNGKNVLSISQHALPEPSYTGEKLWTGTIVNAQTGAAVKEFSFENSLPKTVEWDGLDGSGRFAPDGRYRYVLSVTELAGNSGTFETKEFTLDTSRTELAVSVSPAAFSPDGNGVQDTVTVTPAAKASSGISSYEVKILKKDGSAVKTYSGSAAIPSSFVWDGISDSGEKCSDGVYVVSARTVAKSGTEAEAVSQEFVLDTVAPSAAISVPYKAFSPDGVSSRQTVPVNVESCSSEAKWTAEIRNARNAAVKTFVWNNSAAAGFSWDGTDDNGNKAENGIYSVVLFSRDAAGNSGSASVSGITLDARPVSAFVTAAYKGISPNNDGFLDSQKFNLKVAVTEGIASWKFDVVDSADASVKQFSGGAQDPLPSVITWAGDAADGKSAEGTFRGRLSILYEKGNAAQSSSGPFICTAKPPVLSVKTSPKYFSPDNDGNDDDLFVQLKCGTLAGLKSWSFTVKDRNGKPFWKTGGKSSITERIVWDGRGNNGELVQSAEDYPFEFEANDDLGMKSVVTGVISVDVLVVRDGNKLKMQIPSIIFRSNEADFGVRVLDADGNVVKAGITQAQADNNVRVLKRVSEILKKFKDYKVTVAGHANRTSDNAAEETEEGVWGKALIPLSQQRADYVKERLVKMGVSASRLSVEGKGGTEPVADRKDSSVNWKNRRVEFILEK